MPITRYLKIGEESNFGEEASTMQETLDPESADMDSEDDDKLIYEGMSGLDRLTNVGVYSTSGSVSLPVDDIASGWFWKWCLGSVNTTGSSAPYTHEFSPSRGGTMQSFTAKIGKDVTEHIFMGNIIESIELEIENEWATMSVSTLGAKDKSGTLSDPTFTEGNVFTAPMATMDKEGSDISAGINSMTLTVETGASIEQTQGFGSRFPTEGYQGSMVVTLEITLSFDDTSYLEDFWGQASGPATNSITETAHTLHLGEDYDITFPRMIYTAANAPVEGRDAITQTLTARALYDESNDAGPIQVSLTNGKTSYTVSP